MLPPVTVHISQIKAGDQLRMSMKAGAQLDKDQTGFARSPARGRRAFGWSRTTLYAFVISNDPVAGVMRVNFQDNLGGQGPVILSADVKYEKILHLQQVVPYGRSVVETAPKTHPGAQALGTRMSQLFPQPYLIPVSFVGRG